MVNVAMSKITSDFFLIFSFLLIFSSAVMSELILLIASQLFLLTNGTIRQEDARLEAKEYNET